jgi:hypothetical protein
MTLSPAAPSVSPAAPLGHVQLAVALKARKLADQQAASVLQLIESAAEMLPPTAGEPHVGAVIDERA